MHCISSLIMDKIKMKSCASVKTERYKRRAYEKDHM